ncbi:MAG: anaerobic ribonucleoside-triphosphate reductase [Mycoplasmataceae bacterium]|jgi:anaerobic ribonucleoside-triphosphate reductase|nr:anaerobic ribonucleoside-triphosphate reductase [Mycoplasmataceae bacterium]
MKNTKITNPHKHINFLPSGTKRCPVCNHPTQTISRITGYLSFSENDDNIIQETKGTVKNRFQKGKLAELKLRKSHI